MMECHSKLKFFKTILYLLLNMLILDGDDFEHLFHVENKIFEVAVFLNDLVDGQSDSNNSFSFHVISYLIFFRDEISNMH